VVKEARFPIRRLRSRPCILRADMVFQALARILEPQEIGYKGSCSMRATGWR